jgi:nucleoid DNA-binding protein
MIILDIANELKNRGYEEVPTPDLANVTREAFKAISDMAIKEGEGFILQVPGFGSFRVIRKPARTAFNPQSKQKINVPEKLAFKFKTSSRLKLDLAQSTTAAKKSSKKTTDKKKKKK